MQWDRFQLLLRMLHFCNNADGNNVSRDFKIGQLVEMLIEKYQSIYKPGSKIVIDETMVPFRGRIIFRQYIPGKSHKYGLKTFKLCNTDGYSLNLEIYCGNLPLEQSLSKTETLVVRLLRPYLDTGSTLFTDNYYTSNVLAEHLLTKKTYICGTVRTNRKGLPSDVTKAKLKKGELKGMESDKGVKIFNWKDKRNVLTLSSVPEHSNELVDTGKMSRGGVPIRKPQSVLDYNGAKKGVDISDQMSSYYTALKKSRKCYKKIANELLTGTSIVNAWILYNKFYVTEKCIVGISQFAFIY